MLLTEDRTKEEWASEKWNFQDNYGRSVRKVHAKSNPHVSLDESEESSESEVVLTEDTMKEILTSVEGIGKKKSEKILKKFDTVELVKTLEKAPEKLVEEVSWFKKKMLKQLNSAWDAFKSKL